MKHLLLQMGVLEGCQLSICPSQRRAEAPRKILYVMHQPGLIAEQPLEQQLQGHLHIPVSAANPDPSDLLHKATVNCHTFRGSWAQQGGAWPSCCHGLQWVEPQWLFTHYCQDVHPLGNTSQSTLWLHARVIFVKCSTHLAETFPRIVTAAMRRCDILKVEGVDSSPISDSLVFLLTMASLRRSPRCRSCRAVCSAPWASPLAPR